MTPDEVAAMGNGKLETWLHKSDGFMAGVVMLFPQLLRPVMSYLEKGGIKKKEAYLKSLNTN